MDIEGIKKDCSTCFLSSGDCPVGGEPENCEEWMADYSVLREENDHLKSALRQIASGDFGAVDKPANTGDIYLALENFVKKVLGE